MSMAPVDDQPSCSSRSNFGAMAVSLSFGSVPIFERMIACKQTDERRQAGTVASRFRRRNLWVGSSKLADEGGKLNEFSVGQQ